MGMCLFRPLVIRPTKTHLNTRLKQDLIKTAGSHSREAEDLTPALDAQIRMNVKEFNLTGKQNWAC